MRRYFEHPFPYQNFNLLFYISTIQWFLVQFQFVIIIFFLIFIYLFIYFWPCWVLVSVRGLSLLAASGGLLIAVHGPLTIAASLVAEHRLQKHRLSSCGSRAQLLRGMWDPPRPGLEPVSPASAGRLSTTAPPRKPYYLFLMPKLTSGNTFKWDSIALFFVVVLF